MRITDNLPLRSEGSRRPSLGERSQADDGAGIRPTKQKQRAPVHETDPAVQLPDAEQREGREYRPGSLRRFGYECVIAVEQDKHTQSML